MILLTTSRLTTFLMCMSCFIVAFGEIKPTQQATILEHLLTVNQQWHHNKHLYKTDMLTQQISFTSDVDRIQFHLRLVEQGLNSKYHANFSPAQQQERTNLLTLLHQYWNDNCYPTNYYHSQRTPYFIDEHNTACAVGYLMIASGFETEAQAIQQADNNGYIFDLVKKYPVIDTWATNHGFTLAELAWIQPGYVPAGPDRPKFWQQVFDLSGDVTAIYEESNYAMLAFYNSVNNTSTIVEFNPTTATTTIIAPTLTGKVNSLCIHFGQTYAGGSFSSGSYNLAKLNDNNWELSSIFNDPINVLYSLSGILYAGGGQDSVSPSGRIVRKIGNSWVNMGASFNGPVHSLSQYGGLIVAGGNFSSADGLPVNNIALWIGDMWLQLGNDGLNNTVYDLMFHNNILYATGELFDADNNTSFGFASFNSSTNSWEKLINTTNCPYLHPSTFEAFYSLAAKDDLIVIGGDFEINDFDNQNFGSHVFIYDLLSQTFNTTIIANDIVNKVAIVEDNLLVGGNFNLVSSDYWGGTFAPNGLAFAPLNGAQFKLSVFLSGFYNGDNFQMTAYLQEDNLLPLTQPYNTAPWYYEGTECTDNLPTNAIDWVLIEARSASNSNLVVATKAALLLANGNIVDANNVNTTINNYFSFDNLPDHAYDTGVYLSVKHRNHVGVLSNNLLKPGINQVGANLFFPDFVEGGNTQLQTLEGGLHYGMMAGDIDGNGVISINDYNIYADVASTINNYLTADTNGDGNVTVIDYNFYSANASKIGVPQVRY